MPNQWAKNDWLASTPIDFNRLNDIGNSIRFWGYGETPGTVTVNANSNNLTNGGQFVCASQGIGVAPIWQLHIKGAAQSVANITDAGAKNGSIFVQDSGGSAGSGGAIVIGSGNDHYAALKGLLESGTNIGSLVVSTRRQASDAFLTEALRINSAGRLGVGPGASTSHQVHVRGTGQTTSALTDAGSVDATVYIQSVDGSGGSGGALLLGSGNGSFAALKGLLESGLRTGGLAVATRASDGATALVERLRIYSTGIVQISSSAWDGGHLVMGSVHLWIDSLGQLRRKTGAPISDVDGTIVG
jgi:hypothetical protein